ncbi:hypothetical protein HDU87_002605 [Geranomyces variabilis]|uniref:DNA/pantothenate metabolism flavoprotein C-terminal domain-containing protein n=1 Tax=Geranomyces variabilis TaxID=109894 RepID=A0AAD5TRV7_9FUNG|nr:hypothetical protein HDU87_002605 [Geranomyces variabilis]
MSTAATAPTAGSSATNASPPPPPPSSSSSPPSPARRTSAVGWEEYFSTYPAPPGTDTAGARIDAFVAFHARAQRRVVLVTSGGTTVPLEKNTVRFIDNFSAGTRGATSAECFIEAGYAVIFLHRQFSLQPYSRDYTHSKNCFLDYMHARADGTLEVDAKYSGHMKEVLAKYQKAKSENLLIMESFITVEDYLFLLRRFTTAMSVLRENAMYYLAAAVSDFFVPKDKMIEHKIQSSGGHLELQLDPVPKVIVPLVETWASKGFIVSFKLETEPAILIPKSRRALERYNHQLVIGNILSTRKKLVTMVTLDAVETIELSDAELAQGVEIESRIIPDLVRRHDLWIGDGAPQHGAPLCTSTTTAAE